MSKTYAHSGNGSSSAKMVRKAMKAELLDAETELDLARRWRDHQDEKALHRLIQAYMRLAVSMASKYKRYGTSMSDIIQEASVGLMKAAEKFDPERGVRFSTYATWWIKASIQDFVMRNWSLVRTGSTSSQKALFFNLRRVKARLERESGIQSLANCTPEIKQSIADEIGVSIRDVEMMDARLSGSDFSLNALQTGEEGREWVETLEDESMQAEQSVAEKTDLTRIQNWINTAIMTLPEREQLIIEKRKMADQPATLEALGTLLGLSKERVRQLEVQALSKLKMCLEATHGNKAAELSYALAN